MDDKLSKIAQRLSTWQQIRDKTSPGRWVTENFSDDYKAHMTKLREEIDDPLREEASKFKDLIKKSRKALKERRFIDVATYIGEINDGLRKFSDKSKILFDQSQSYYGELYSKTENESESDYAGGVHSADYFDKKAGVWNAAKTFIARRQLEKLNRERIMAMNALVNRTETFVKYVLAVLDELVVIRRQGDINKYVAKLKVVANRHKEFEKEFKKVYNVNVRPLIAYRQGGPFTDNSQTNAPGAGQGAGTDLPAPAAPLQQVAPAAAQVPSQAIPEAPAGASVPLATAAWRAAIKRG